MLYYIIFTVLSVLTLYLAFRLLILKKAIARANRELQEISSDLKENRIVKLAVPEKELESLLESINRNLQAIRIEHKNYQQKEIQLKEQIENISHDLRTPLTAILGFLKMIDPDGLPPCDREYLSVAIKKSYTLQDLIEQFYELSRVTAEGFCLKLAPVDAARILKESCLGHYALFEKEMISANLPSFDHPVTISGDSDALKRVFANLVQNSIRYAKSELNIKIERIAETGGVKFVFSNDITPEQEIDDPSKLFDRFYVQEQSRNRGGTGLGLTISKSLVEHMGGTMEANYYTADGKRFLAFLICFP